MRSRIGRRVVALFVLSALLPLCLCTAFLLRQFDRQMVATQEDHLDGLVRSFGMTILGRLGSADDVLKAIVSAPGTTDAAIQDAVARLRWVRSVTRAAPGTRWYPTDRTLPMPNPRQSTALQAGRPVILTNLGERGNPRVFIVRALPGGARLYVEISSTWLWNDAGDFAAEAGLMVLDSRGAILASAGDVPRNLNRAGLRSVVVGGGAHHREAGRGAGALPSAWMFRRWEAFLGSRFASPSWYLVAMAPHASMLSASNDSYLFLVGIAALTILLISWLSIATIRKQLHPLEMLTKATQRVAMRDFDAFRDLSWDDEFGDLANAFREMSGKLKRQFSALEMLSEVDRLLLHAPELERILDRLLPQMAAVLHCECVSVLLFDPDSEGHARAYDHFSSDGAQRPIRRITTDVATLKSGCEQAPATLIDAAAARSIPYFAPIALPGIDRFRVQPLEHDEHCTGLLCVGYRDDDAGLQDPGVGVHDLADRLSVILANLKQSESLHRQANYDALTGLQNRNSFADRARIAIAAAQERNGLGALLYLDLDHFKRVNDTAGHSAGDGLLRVVGQRIAACVGDDRQVARLAGDEFAVLLPSMGDADAARRVAERIIAELQMPVEIDGREHLVSASVGMTVFPSDGTTLEDLLKGGDIAMYQAKDAGRGRAMFFQAEMQLHLEERMKLETGMRRALLQNEFVLHFQPIVSETSPGTIGVEALIRWPESGTPWVSPAIFVPMAEENGLIVPLGDWILRSACQQFFLWRSQGLRLDYVSVNVSVRQIREREFLGRLDDALLLSGMRADQLQIEITESVLAHGEELRRTLTEITERGVRLALDDFGTGYSSLSYLRTYPIHTVKIDQSFVRELPQDPAACRLAESIIVMCAALGKHVVAEGVETDDQRRFLRQAGCSTIQGYLLGRPMAAGDIPGFMRRLRAQPGSTRGEELPESACRAV